MAKKCKKTAQKPEEKKGQPSVSETKIAMQKKHGKKKGRELFERWVKDSVSEIRELVPFVVDGEARGE
jgi:hypothetical protein